MVHSLETQKGLELVVWLHYLQKFFVSFFVLQNDIYLPNFINKMCLLPKLFSKMYLFYA